MAEGWGVCVPGLGECRLLGDRLVAVYTGGDWVLRREVGVAVEAAFAAGVCG